MSNATQKKLLRILCLHGYRQSGDTFKQKLGALRKILKKDAELVFITAPNQVPAVETTSKTSEETDSNEYYGWWFSSENKTFDSKKASDVAIGFENSFKLVEKTFEEQGPFDGLLGFSQGAAFVGILCAMQDIRLLKYEFSFAIMIAGFKSRCHPHMNYYHKPSSVPSLHVFGESDQVISKEMSEALMEQFVDSEVIVHPGGHYVPASSSEKQGYLSFLQVQSMEIEEKDERKSQILEGEDDTDDKEIHVNNDSNSSYEETRKTKANKGGISKQKRKLMAQNAKKLEKNNKLCNAIPQTEINK